jgi:hypothetical protein
VKVLQFVEPEPEIKLEYSSPVAKKYLPDGSTTPTVGFLLLREEAL